MKSNISKVEKIIDGVCKQIDRNFKTNNDSKTIQLIRTYATIMYTYNQEYINEEIESILNKIVTRNFLRPKLKKNDLDKDTIVFYDGFRC